MKIKMNLLKSSAILAAGTMLMTIGLAPLAAEEQIRGAGATFPAPIYVKWFANFQKATGTSVDYQSIGSGPGYNAIKNKTVDFGASDAPLSAAEEAAMPGGVVHIPTVGGAVVLTYNLPGVGSGLRFTPQIIASIFLGKIKNWNDPLIKAANAGKMLPDTAIQPVHRTDSSGTTYIFTNYLKKADSEWAGGPGAGKSVNWPVGLGGKGNAGVSAVVKRTPGSFAYVELAYAIENKLPFGSVRNRSGNYVTPSSESTSEAINQYVSELRRNIKTPTVDAKGVNSYPICSLTYILIYKDGSGKAALTTKLWSWIMKPEQQGMAKSLYYAPLPASLVQLNLQTLKSIHGAQVSSAK